MSAQAMRSFFLALPLMLLGSPAFSQAVFPPLVEGSYRFKISASTTYDTGGIPLNPLTLSMGIVEPSVNGSVPIACAPLTADRTSQEAIHVIQVTISVSGSRREFRGVSYSLGQCTGETSALSAATAYIFFGPPNAPALITGQLLRGNEVASR